MEPTCRYCRFSLSAETPVIQCPECRSRYHRDCWNDAQGCGLPGCPAAARSPAPDANDTTLNMPIERVPTSVGLPPVERRSALVFAAPDPSPPPNPPPRQRRRRVPVLPILVLCAAVGFAGVAAVMALSSGGSPRRKATHVTNARAQRSTGGGTQSHSTAAATTTAAPISSRPATSPPTRSATPTVGRYLASAAGAIGNLVLNRATEAEVVGIWGEPNFRGTWNSPGPSFDSGLVLGYTCSTTGGSSTSPGTVSVTTANGITTGCADVFYINDRTLRLAAFRSADPRIHTRAGTHPGMSQSVASELEGQTATIGCMPGIYEPTPTADLVLLNTGGQSNPGSTIIDTGTVAMLELEARRNAVGILFC